MASALCEFNPYDDLPKDFMMIVYGKRRTGKTTLILHMLDGMMDRFKHHKVHVFSGTADVNPSQWKYFPETAVHADIGTMNDKIEELLEGQKRAIMKEIRNQMRRGGESSAGEVEVRSSSVNVPQDTHVMDETEKKQKKRKREDKQAVKVLYRHDYKSSRGKKMTANGHGRLRELHNEQKPHVVVPDDDSDEESEGVQDDVITEEEVNKKFRSGDYDKSTMPHHLVILDDVVDDNCVRTCKALNKLAVSGRHWFFTVIILSQCIAGSGSVPPVIRINADSIICVYNPRSKQERKLLSEQYLSPGASDPKAGLKLLADITRVPFRSIVIDVTNTTATEYGEFIYTYGPVPEPPKHISKKFKLGTEEQWQESTNMQRKPKFNKETDLTKSKKDANRIDSGRFHMVNPLNDNDNDKFFRSVF